MFLLHQLPGIAIGLLVGCFIPGLLRKVHAWISKQVTTETLFAEVEARKLDNKLKEALGSVEKKL